MQNNWIPFGKNILFSPASKNKVVGDSSKYFFYGKVLAIGDEVKKIKVGDTIGFTQWALSKIVMGDKGEQEYFFCPESDDFILGVLKNDQA